MRNRLKNLMLIILCAALTLSVFALPVRLTSSDGLLLPEAADGPIATEALPSQQDAAYKGFLDKTTAIYQQYDSAVDSDSYGNPYALRRIMVTGFNGDTYGACDYAYDSANDFAVLQYPTEAAAEDALRTMLADGVQAEPDTIAVMDATGKCTFDPVADARLGLPTFFEHYQMASDTVLVAVLDTGVMYDHKAIADRFYSKGVDLSGDGKKDAYYDTEQVSNMYSHGTFIAGILADNTPDTVKVQPYKIVGFESTFAPSSAIVTGINTAVMDGVSVVNISSHTNGGATTIERAVKNANNKGVCVCASAGNKNEYVENAYPACTPGVITVTATDGDAFASFSSYGDVVDFAAPGKNIRSTYAGEGGLLMSRWNGTSFSTPYIAAMCANAKSMNKKMTRNEVYDMLTHCADDYGEAGYDIYFGYGVPNFSAIHYEGEGYAYDLPQGTLTVTAGHDYTLQDCPWRLYTQKMLNVTVADSVTAIGKYTFYNMTSADFTVPQSLEAVGDYAFYNCDKLTSYAFDENVEKIGYKAFGDIEGFALSGYRNTPAETYAISEGLPFTILGCKHNYIFEVFDPTETEEGYTEYTCTVCGESYRGAYIPPVVLASGRCGDALTYVLYDNGKLVLDGSGAMDDYFEKEAPWFAYRDRIQILEIRKDVTAIDAFAFYGCDRLSKIRCAAANTAMQSDGISLTDSTKHTLLLTAAKGTYTLPEEVTSVSAPALITLGNAAIEPNSHFTMKDGILYDTAGSMICALPSFAAESFTIDKNTTIKQYAFMYTSYPKKLDTNLLRIVFEPYSIGYYYDGTLQKTDLSVKAFAESTAYQYADENGFEVDGANIGKCGEDITWRYDETAKSLTFSGTGDMFVYSTVESMPWSDYLPTLKTVTIGDDIRSIADYTFSGAKVLNKVTMPLSLKAPLLPETWKGCTAIKTIKLTYGTGYMDDYTDTDDPNVYSYTPWYLSRNSITSFTLDPNVKYIGKEAFRNCLAIKALTLNEIEGVAEDAFINCSKLKNVTINSKSCELPDHCFFFLKSAGNYMIYSNVFIHAYDDSTARDYAVKMKSGFTSLGCGHSRHLSLKEQEGEQGACVWQCDDCGETFTEYPAESGHIPAAAVSENEISATCTAEGSYDLVVYCTDCGEELSRVHYTVAALSHQPAEAVREKELQATCTADGSYEAVVYCTLCGAELSRETKVLEKTAHTPVTDAAVPATCQATGLTEGSHCAVCGEVLVAQTVVPVAGHTVVTDAAKAATCTATGLTAGSHCAVCGEVLVAQTVVPATGHTVVTDAAKAPTCTETGLTEGCRCIRCGEVLQNQETVAALGHRWDDGVITKPATGSAAGEKTYTCTVCGATRTEALPAQKTGWQKENGKWYYYNNVGAVVTGWQKISNVWYWFNSAGVMQTGWQKIGNVWYWFNSSGAMATGWQKISNVWYWFNSSGAMVTGWQKISSKWYWFNSAGAMATGWQKISNKWYYFNSGGDMITGWKKIGSSWYFFNSGGDMRTASLTQGGKTYYFNTSGACTNP